MLIYHIVYALSLNVTPKLSENRYNRNLWMFFVVFAPSVRLSTCTGSCCWLSTRKSKERSERGCLFPITDTGEAVTHTLSHTHTAHSVWLRLSVTVRLWFPLKAEAESWVCLRRCQVCRERNVICVEAKWKQMFQKGCYIYWCNKWVWPRLNHRSSNCCHFLMCFIYLFSQRRSFISWLQSRRHLQAPAQHRLLQPAWS